MGTAVEVRDVSLGGDATGAGRVERPISPVMFFVATFAMSWGIGALGAFLPDQVEALVGPMGMNNPLSMLVVCSPAIVGIGLVWRHHGAGGLRRYLGRLMFIRGEAPTEVCPAPADLRRQEG